MTAEPAVTVLLVDDNAGKRLALQAILSPLGYAVVEANSGREALRCVMTQEFAVILMDVVMPGMDGFDTAAAIRQRQESQMTPIIFITGHAKDEIRKHDLYAEGAVDFIFAPVPPDELRAKVSVFANLYIQAEELAARAREVQTSADQLRLLTDAAPVGIFQTDAENRYVYTNPRWSEITGIPAAEAEGRAWDTIISPTERSGLAAQLAQGPADGAELSQRFELERPGSNPLIVVATSRSVPGESGTTAGWVGTLADVTAEAGAEEAMSDARDEAKKASRLKSDFLANMSHEIRTPMNGVIGMTDLLLETSLDDRQRDYAVTVRNSGDALLTIIDDILDISKIEAGQLEIEQVDFDLRATVEAVVDLLAGSAQGKGVQMVMAIDAAVPAVVSGDPGRVRQVLLNLIGNAIKFTQGGEVVVRVTVADATGDQTLVRFEVSDTGDGMAPDKLGHVFQPFVQADTSTSRKYGGTGLGLAISSQLVELMGGDCGVSSRLGEGSDFWFTICVRVDTAQASAPQPSSDAGLAGLGLLIVDSNATQRAVLSEYATAWGMRVEAVDSGHAALSALRAGASEGRPFQVALLDRSAKGVACEALKDEIVADPALIAGPALMIDLGEQHGHRQERDAGACPYVSKPVHLEDLRRCLRVAAGLDEVETRLPDAGAEALAAAEPAAGCLLVAEDNLVNQKVAVAMLSGAGYRVDTALTGKEAVEAVARRRYDAILMDCQMPELNGYEATTAIRAYEDPGPYTPIIALTAGARPTDRVRCLTAGMDDYLTKPVSKDALLAMVASHMRRDQPATGTLDEEVVAELEALDGETLSGLTTLFFESAVEQLSDLSGAVGRGEAPAVGQMAHRLKGSSCTVGAANVSRLASELETTAMAGDLTTADALLDQLDAGLDDARGAFRSRA